MAATPPLGNGGNGHRVDYPPPSWERGKRPLCRLPSPADAPRRYRVGLITAESEASRFVRHRRLIRFPQLTMPLLAAHTPVYWEVGHTDEIVQRVDFEKKIDLAGITA